MNSNLNSKKASLWIGLLSVFLVHWGCGKNLAQVFFHPSVDSRVNDSLSGLHSIQKQLTVTDQSNFSFAVFGDIHVNKDNVTLMTQFKADVSSRQISFFVVLGDITEDGTTDQLNTAKGLLDDVGVPYILTLGNHDLYQASDKGGWGGWLDTFGNATFSVTVGNSVRIILLDTASSEIGEKQFRWLENQLTTPVPFTFVGSHYPIYDGAAPTIWRLESTEERYRLIGLLNKYSVYAYVAAHTHGYRKSLLGSLNHYVIGSMYPFTLDYGEHGYLLFKYLNGQMSSERVVLPGK